MAGYSQGGLNISGQFGMPLYGVAGLPPFTGNVFWVNQTLGSDGNTGGPADPLATLSEAHSRCLTNNNDVVFLTGTVNITSTLTWSKSRTHLIGLAPQLLSQARARISQTGSSVFTPLVTVSGSECIMRDIGTFHGFANASAQIAVEVSGGRNEFTRLLFGGMGNATAAAQVGGRSLLLSGSTGENTFRQCQIGLDTISRTGANASLEFSGGNPRNVFEECIFPMLAGDANPLFGKTAAAASIDRFQLFRKCLFTNGIGSTGTAITQAFTMAASAGGVMIMQDCMLLGGNTSTNWGDAAAMAQMYIDSAQPAASTGGLAVNPT
jgi:hypothetical protein